MKVTDTAAYTDRVLKGHEGPVLSLSLDPRKEFLASASCDGSLRIWSLRDTTQVGIFQCCGSRDVFPGSEFAIPDRGSKRIRRKKDQKESRIRSKEFKYF